MNKRRVPLAITKSSKAEAKNVHGYDAGSFWERLQVVDHFGDEPTWAGPFTKNFGCPPRNCRHSIKASSARSSSSQNSAKDIIIQWYFQPSHNVYVAMSNAARLYNQSLKYLEGNGVSKDEAKAFAMNSEAAESGDHDAVLAVGWFYLNGIGVKPDAEKAEYWYRKSARQGETRAMFSLGQMAYLAKAYEDALLWFNRAADKGHKRSLYWLGKLYWRGQGVAASDKKRAMALFQRAAKKDVAEARRLVRYMSRRRP